MVPAGTSSGDTTARRSAGVADVEPGDPRALELALLQTVMLARELRPKLLKGGGISKTFFSRLMAFLFDPGVKPTPEQAHEREAYLHFLAGLARAAGLLVERDDRLEPDIKACAACSALDRETRLAMLRAAWLDTAEFNEFFFLPGIEIVASKQPDMLSRRDCVPSAERMASIRRAVIASVEEQPEGRWIRVDAFGERFRKRHPDLLVNGDEHANAFYSGIRKRGSKQDLRRDSGWAEVEGGLIELLLSLPLRQLGYIDTGRREGAMTALRRRAKPFEDTAPEPNPAPLLIQPNFEVMALVPESAMGTLWSLARVASLKHMGQAATFVIEERWVAETINREGSAAALLDSLAAASRGPVPQNVRYSIEDWGRRAQRIAIYTDAVLFEAEGAERIEALVNEAYRKRAVLRELGPHLIASAQACPPPSQGVAPRYPVLDYSRALPPAVAAMADGSLACAREAMHFRAQRVMQRLAEQVSLERWRITRASWSAAIKAGLPYERAIEMLGEVLKGEAPPMLRLCLAAWSGRLGRVRLRQATLLEFQQPEAAALLRDDTEARKLIAGELGDTTLEVDAGSEAALRRLLAERAIDVDEEA